MILSKEFLTVEKRRPSQRANFFLIRTEGKDIVLLSITIRPDGGCLRKDSSKATFLFRDGSTLELTHNTSTDCSGTFMSAITQSEIIEELMTKEIEAVRVRGTRGGVEVDFSQKQSETFRKTLECMMNN